MATSSSFRNSIDDENKSDWRNKRSVGEKIMSFIFDGPPGTNSSTNARELRYKEEEDKLNISRTQKEEKERQMRIRKRAEVLGGGDGVRTNDMQKEGWEGANLAP